MKLSTKYLLALVPIVIMGVIIYLFSDIVSYVVIAWVVSMLGAPLVKFFTKYLGSSISAGITLVILIGLFLLLIRIFIPPIVQQASNLASIDYNSIVDSLDEPLKDWESWLEDKGLISIDTLVTNSNKTTESDIDKLIKAKIIDVDQLARENGDTTSNTNITLMVNVMPDHDHLDNQLVDTVDSNLSVVEKMRNNVADFLNPSRVTKVFGSIFGFFSNFLIALMSIMFIAFFFLKEQGLVDRIITSIVPDKRVDQALKAMDESTGLLIRYFFGIIIQVSLITLFVTILLSIFGVKNALLIGFFAALMNIIPYLGPLFGATFAVIITISSNLDLSFYNEMLPLLGKVIGVFAIMQVLDNFVLQPTIFSRSVKAHPLEIFIIVLIGAKFGGVIGMVLAIPAYTVFRVLGKIFFSEFKVIQSLTKSIQ